jgi:hypothetical protein
MTNQGYVGTAERTFPQALVYLLESQYAVLGSRRVLELLAQDVQHLVEQFYPAPERLSPGWMIFTGTRATGAKAHPGQKVGEHELVTIAWPVLLPEDAEFLANREEQLHVRREWFRRRLVRILEHGYHHPNGPVLLTNADLSCMLGVRMSEISQLLNEARRETGKPLLTKGYYFDQGVKPSHKDEIIELYEAGRDEAEIARQSEHAPESVGRYIRDYERIKLLLKQATPVEQIAPLINLQPSVVKAYVILIARFHPQLLPAQSLSTTQANSENGDK